MKYADYPAEIQAMIAVRDCGVLRVTKKTEPRFVEAMRCGFINIVVGRKRAYLDARLSEAGRVVLQEMGLGA